MEHELKGIRYQSEKYSKLTTLINRVNEESLKAAHRKQKTGKAAGIDGETRNPTVLGWMRMSKDWLTG